MYEDNISSIHTTGISWPEPNRQPNIESQKLSIRQKYNSIEKPSSINPSIINSSSTANPSEISLEGKAIQLGRLLQARKQAQDIQKVTIYLPKNLCSVLVLLKRQQIIDSFSQTIKDALYQYLTDNDDPEKKRE
jgi:hypothetical protein